MRMQTVGEDSQDAFTVAIYDIVDLHFCNILHGLVLHLIRYHSIQDREDATYEHVLQVVERDIGGAIQARTVG